jgi:hypothetical protein
MNDVNAGPGSSPAATSFIAAILPRGEADSSPVRR